MIEVYATERGGKSRLWVKGHATKGVDRDIVCAGVSALVQALILYAAERPETRRRLRYQLRSGEAFFSCYGIGQGFGVALRGLLSIAREHPEHLLIRSFPAVDDKCHAT